MIWGCLSLGSLEALPVGSSVDIRIFESKRSWKPIRVILRKFGDSQYYIIRGTSRTEALCLEFDVLVANEVGRTL